MNETVEVIRLTADVVALGEDTDGTRHVLLVRRRYDPFAGRWALPSGHTDPGETVEDAARRELAEETGIAAGNLTLITYASAPGRDPRGRYVSAVFLGRFAGLPSSVGGDDADAAKWVPIGDALGWELAFDHGSLLREALASVLAEGER